MAYLLAVSLIWAFSFGLIGNALQGLDSISVAGARLGIALLIFLPLLRMGRIAPPDRLRLFLCGAVQFGVMYVCYISAFQYIASHLVALFSVLTPVYIVMIHALKQKQFSIGYLFVAILAVIGAAIIKAKNGEVGNIWLGFILMQIAGIAFAFGQVYYREWKQKHSAVKDWQVFGLLYLGGAVTAFVSAAVISGRIPFMLNATMEQWVVIIYLGAVASGLGFFLWNKGATSTSPGILAAFNNVVVPLAMFASLFVFGEASNVSTNDLVRLALGSAFIGAAVALGVRNNLANANKN